MFSTAHLSACICQIALRTPPKKLYPVHLCRFDKNQRVQNVTHKGGTEQMIESARKDPAPLHAAIDQAVNPEHAAASRALEAGFQLQLDRNMQQVQGRILPGPWLSYQQGGGPGLGQMRAINTGTTGKWNMEGKKFSSKGRTLGSVQAWCADKCMQQLQC